MRRCFGQKCIVRTTITLKDTYNIAHHENDSQSVHVLKFFYAIVNVLWMKSMVPKTLKKESKRNEGGSERLTKLSIFMKGRNSPQVKYAS